MTLIVTVHLGEASYCRKLRELIDQREADGAVGQCEMVLRRLRRWVAPA